MNWFVYILRCGNDDLYTDLTPDLERGRRRPRVSSE